MGSNGNIKYMIKNYYNSKSQNTKPFTYRHRVISLNPGQFITYESQNRENAAGAQSYQIDIFLSAPNPSVRLYREEKTSHHLEHHLCQKHIIKRSLFQYQMRKKTICHKGNPWIVDRCIAVSPNAQKHHAVQAEHKGFQPCIETVSTILCREYKEKRGNKGAAHKLNAHGGHRLPDIPGEQFQQIPCVLDCAKETDAEHQLRERTFTLPRHKYYKTKASQNRQDL